jgi:hypothetical protein
MSSSEWTEFCLHINKKLSWSADKQLFVSPAVSKVSKVTNCLEKLQSFFFKFCTIELLETYSYYTERLFCWFTYGKSTTNFENQEELYDNYTSVNSVLYLRKLD